MSTTWYKIGTADKGAWGIWRRENESGETVFQLTPAPLIPLTGHGRESYETLLAMKGFVQDVEQDI